MLIDDLISIKNSLETTYKDFGKMKPYMLLKFCKNIILREKDNFSQTELLSIINQIFGTNISYIIFNKFFHSFIKTEKSSKKKELKKTKDEVEIKNEDIKKDSSNDDEPIKKSDDIVPKDTKKVNSKMITPDLPKVETQTGIIESKNTKRIK